MPDQRQTDALTQPRVFVSISFFNDERTLADAITSVLNQTYRNWHVLLIDDGSRDRSLEVARTFVGDRVSVLSDGANRGLVDRLNHGIERADGKYYARMDADDLMHPERIEKQVAFLETHPDVDLVDSSMYVMTREGGINAVRARRPPEPWTLRGVLQGHIVNHAAALGRLEWFRANPYDPQYVRAEDFELWCRTVERSRFARIMEPLYYVREGRINIRSYRLARATSRRIIREFGPRALSWRERQSLWLASFAKVALYTSAGWLGLHGFLTRSRNVALPATQLAIAEAGLRRALAPARA